MEEEIFEELDGFFGGEYTTKDKLAKLADALNSHKADNESVNNIINILKKEVSDLQKEYADLEQGVISNNVSINGIKTGTDSIKSQMEEIREEIKEVVVLSAKPKSHNTLTDVTANQHHEELHSIQSHDDTNATGEQLDALVSEEVTELHKHRAKSIEGLEELIKASAGGRVVSGGGVPAKYILLVDKKNYGTKTITVDDADTPVADSLIVWKHSSGSYVLNMTIDGTITVGRDPTSDLEVATKQYVDNGGASPGFLKLDGSNANQDIDIGSYDFYCKDLYTEGSSIYLGGLKMSEKVPGTPGTPVTCDTGFDGTFTGDGTGLTIYDEFILLGDTPATYAGQKGKYPRVNDDEDGLEFAGTTETMAHVDLTDMPDTGGINSDHDARYYTQSQIDTQMNNKQDTLQYDVGYGAYVVPV